MKVHAPYITMPTHRILRGNPRRCTVPWWTLPWILTCSSKSPLNKPKHRLPPMQQPTINRCSSSSNITCCWVFVGEIFVNLKNLQGFSNGRVNEPVLRRAVFFGSSKWRHFWRVRILREWNTWRDDLCDVSFRKVWEKFIVWIYPAPRIPVTTVMTLHSLPF